MYIIVSFRSVIVILDDDEDNEDSKIRNWKEVLDSFGQGGEETGLSVTDFIPAKRRKFCHRVEPMHETDALSELFTRGSSRVQTPEVGETRSSRTGTQDASELFCMSLVSVMGQLNQCQKSVARMVIQQVLHKIEFEEPEVSNLDVSEMIGKMTPASGTNFSCHEMDETSRNEDELFCRSLAPTLRELDRKKHSLAKFRISEILHKCRFS